LKIADVLYIVPLGGLFIHGKQANIPKGATFTAYIQDAAPAVSANAPEPVPNGESPQ